MLNCNYFSQGPWYPPQCPFYNPTSPFPREKVIRKLALRIEGNVFKVVFHEYKSHYPERSFSWNKVKQSGTITLVPAAYSLDELGSTTRRGPDSAHSLLITSTKGKRCQRRRRWFSHCLDLSSNPLTLSDFPCPRFGPNASSLSTSPQVHCFHCRGLFLLLWPWTDTREKK